MKLVKSMSCQETMGILRFDYGCPWVYKMENHGSTGSYHSQVVIGLDLYVSWVLVG